MAGALRVHVMAAGPGVSLCGRFCAEGDPANEHVRVRFTSRVTCHWCIRARSRATSTRSIIRTQCQPSTSRARGVPAARNSGHSEGQAA